jgi:hypothetical protein
VRRASHQILAGVHHIADRDRELFELVDGHLHSEVLDVRRRVQPGHENRAVVDVVHSGEHYLVSVLYGEPACTFAGCIRMLGPGGGVKMLRRGLSLGRGGAYQTRVPLLIGMLISASRPPGCADAGRCYLCSPRLPCAGGINNADGTRSTGKQQTSGKSLIEDCEDFDGNSGEYASLSTCPLSAPCRAAAGLHLSPRGCRSLLLSARCRPLAAVR